MFEITMQFLSVVYVPFLFDPLLYFLLFRHYKTSLSQNCPVITESSPQKYFHLRERVVYHLFLKVNSAVLQNHIHLFALNLEAINLGETLLLSFFNILLLFLCFQVTAVVLQSV